MTDILRIRSNKFNLSNMLNMIVSGPANSLSDGGSRSMSLTKSVTSGLLRRLKCSSCRRRAMPGGNTCSVKVRKRISVKMSSSISEAYSDTIVV